MTVIMTQLQSAAHLSTILMNQIQSFKDFLTVYTQRLEDSGAMERIIPRSFSSEQDIRNLTSNLHYSQAHNHLNSLTKSLSEPIWDLLDRGGKKWRPLLTILVAEIYNYGQGRNPVSEQQVHELASLVEIVHNGTLMVDDIQDDSKTRRNKECVHLLFGVDISLNAGNFMYFAPIAYILHRSTFEEKVKLDISKTFLEEMTNLHIGQAWDILWHNPDKLTGEYPTQNQYLQMTSHKTGVLARLAVRLISVALGLPQGDIQSLSDFAQKIGVAFQIQNDLLNLEGQEYVSVKGYAGEDIHQGKFSLIVLHCISASKNCQRLIEILKSHPTDQTVIDEAISILKESGSLEYARSVMHRLLEEAWADIQARLPQHPFKKFLKDLAYMNMTSKGT